MSSNKFEKYCEAIVVVLRDEKKCLASFELAAKALDGALGNDYARDKAKDASLLSTAETHCKSA
jgi:hypothetical protein